MFGRGFKSLRLHKIKAHEKLGFYFLGGMRTRKEGSNYLVPACVRGFGTEQIPPAPQNKSPRKVGLLFFRRDENPKGGFELSRSGLCAGFWDGTNPSGSKICKQNVSKPYK